MTRGAPDTAEPPLRTVTATPGALVLLGTSLIGRLPTAMAALAIVQLVRLQEGGFALAGGMTAAYIVGGALGQPLLARAIDGTRPTPVLVATGIGSALAFIGLALTAAVSPVLGLLLAAAAGLLAAPLEPALRALWPRLIDPGAPLKAAFGLDAGAQEVLYIVGPLMTSAGVGVLGPRGAVVLAGLLGIAGTLAFAGRRAMLHLPAAPREGRPISSGRRHTSPLREPQLRRLVVFALGAGLPVGALTIAATLVEEHRSIPGLAGWVLAANALGALIGASVVALRPASRPPQAVLARYGVLLAASYLPLTLEGLPPGGYLAAATAAGLMLPPTLVQIFEATHRVSSSSVLTEANAWVVSGVNVGIALGTLGASGVAGAAPGGAIPLFLGLAVALTAVASLVVLPRSMTPVQRSG